MILDLAPFVAAFASSVLVAVPAAATQSPPVPAAPAAPAPPPEKGGTGMVLAGFALATGVASGVSALVGHTLYPEVGAARFAKVGAVSYAVPAGILLVVSRFYVAQKKKSEAEFRQGSPS